ncbi:carbohydrate kinase family protein [Halorubrum sp. LN27]|uniref:carbohydrate kinase family protein n=1 Tax=Halorubrum sp. LN27 TaxID=2801032 RepID=UPI00190CBECE|nr:carbohydrate kinase family protein [Halorubrum sp. LN27]
MQYDALRSRLDGTLDYRDVIALPDGSVDRYYGVTDATGERIATRSAFVDLISADGARSLQLTPEAVRPGGQAVNAARQVSALGPRVTLYGHLDDPALDGFSFPTVSMGSPATVHVLSFDERDLMLSVESDDIREWRVEDLFAAVPAPPDEWLSDEVVVLQNWVGVAGMTDALRALAEVDLGKATVVFDPGDVTASADEPLRALCRALGALADGCEVVLSANDGELGRLADAVGVDATGVGREPELREVLGVDAVVLHDERRAAAATGEMTTVENFDAERVTRRTGAGDRFDGALATGLAAGLPWGECLALGNACATHFVERGETATRRDVRSLLARRGDR